MLWIAFGTIGGLALVFYALMDTATCSDEKPQRAEHRIDQLASLSTLSAGVFDALTDGVDTR